MRDRAARWLEALSIWGLGGLLVTLPFWRHRVLFHRKPEEVFFEFHDVILYTNDVFWIGAIGAWVLSIVVAKRASRLKWGPWFVSGPLVGLLVLSAIGAGFGIDLQNSAYLLLRMVLLFSLYLMLLNASLSSGAVAWPLAAGMVIQAGVGLPQFALRHWVGLKRIGEVPMDAAWPGASVVMAGEERWLRAYGFAQHPNLLAGCLMVMLLLVVGYYLSQRGWRRALLLLALSLGWTTLLLTFSRAAWMGLMAGGVVGWRLMVRQGTSLKHWQKTGIALLTAVAGAIALYFLAVNWPVLVRRLGFTSQGTEIRSIESRAIQLPAALALIRMRPLLGVGLGNYATALYALAPDLVAAYPVYQPVYSVPLLVTAELGPLGGIVWLGLLILPWLQILRNRRHLRITPWFAAGGAGLLGLSLISFFDFYVWTSHQGQLALWIVLGLFSREWLAARGQGTSAREAIRR